MSTESCMSPDEDSATANGPGDHRLEYRGNTYLRYSPVIILFF